MTKIRMVRLYKTKDVPDHILEEVEALVKRLAKGLGDICADSSPNIILSAMNRFHALMICGIVADSSLKEGAQTEAIGLVKNIEHISGQKIFEDDNED